MMENIRLKAVNYLIENLNLYVECRDECRVCKLEIFIALLRGYAEIGVIKWYDVFKVSNLLAAKNYNGIVAHLSTEGVSDNA